MANSLKAKDLARFVLYKIDKDGDGDQVLKDLEIYLQKINRTDLYPLILGYTKKLFDQENSKRAVKIVSPYEIKSSVRKGIIEKLTDEKASHREEVLESMIGGFEAEYKGRKVGINIRTNLEALKRHIIS